MNVKTASLFVTKNKKHKVCLLSTNHIYIYIYMVFILSKGFSILYRKLARVGFEPMTSCLLCTRS